MNNHLTAIGYCYGAGGAHPGSGHAPVILRHSPYLPALQWQALLQSNDDAMKLAAIPTIAKLCQQLALHTNQLVSQQQPFIVFGGDQTASLGTWSGVAHALRDKESLGLIWFDAHLDSHTLETTESNNVHGMPLACLLGFGDNRLTSILDAKPKLLPQHIFLIGARSFEQGELEL